MEKYNPAKRNVSAPWGTHFRGSQLSPATRFTCVLLLKGALEGTQRSILRLGGHRSPRAPQVESTQLSEPEVVHCGAGRKNSRNAARYATGSSGVVRWQAAPHPVESYLWVKGSVSWGETARSGKAELFLTAKTKLPLFMEIYTLPEKNGGKEKLCREHGFSKNSNRWMVCPLGALSQPPEVGRIGSLINTSLPLEMSHTEFEKLSVCPGWATALKEVISCSGSRLTLLKLSECRKLLINRTDLLNKDVYYTLTPFSPILFAGRFLDQTYKTGINTLNTTAILQFSSVQSLSSVRLCDPMDCSTPGFPVHHRLLQLAETHVHPVIDPIQTSHPLSSPSPAFYLSQHPGLFQWVSSSNQVAKLLKLQLQHQSFQQIFRIDFL